MNEELAGEPAVFNRALSDEEIRKEGERMRIDRVSPWRPMTAPIDLKHLGKYIEECAECTEAAIVLSLSPFSPSLRLELQSEIADVLANSDLVIEHFGLYRSTIVSFAQQEAEESRRNGNGLLHRFAGRLAVAGSRASRCLIQGINETNPDTGTPNIVILAWTMARVLGAADVVISEYEMDRSAVLERAQRKMKALRRWHEMLGSAAT